MDKARRDSFGLSKAEELLRGGGWHAHGHIILVSFMM